MILFSRLDLTLALRMLVKYRGLSAIAVVGMAVAIAIGAGTVGFFEGLFNATLPLEDPHQIVAIQYYDPAAERPRQTAGDFVALRSALASIKDLATFRDTRRNLFAPGRPPEPVDVAEMTVSGFRMTRTPPLRGRTLMDEDELPGAPPVLVISQGEWLRRFDGDPAVIGQRVRLGSEEHTIVGVMPDGFHFPINHRYWTVLRVPATTEPGNGPSVSIFGRLAGGSTVDQARTELALVRERMAAAYPQTHSRLRARLLPYAYAAIGVAGDDRAIMRVWQVIVSLLLVVVAVNVAVLVYARTAARAGEIAVRTALGASRARIVTQLFVEAFVLSGTAAVLGLTIAALALGEVAKILGDSLPYWMTFGLSPSIVFYVAGLAVLAALVVGVLPALNGTGRRVHAGLQQLASRGSQMRLGRLWTLMIVAQVAVAVAVLPGAVDVAASTIASATSTVHYPIEEFLRASLSLDRGAIDPPLDTVEYRRARESAFRADAAELLRRLEAEPAVAGVSFATDFGAGGSFGRIEVDRADRPGEPGSVHTVWTNRVATNFFSVLDVPSIAGRLFTNADAREGTAAVIVDRAFAEQVLGEGNPLGRRVRTVAWTDDVRAADADRGPWLEIVGVVPNFMTGGDDIPPPGLYRAVRLDQLSAPLSLAIRVRAKPITTFTPRLREITAAVDPTLQLDGLQSAADAERERKYGLGLIALATVTATGSVLLLSAAGIYAMMSFTVMRRRREIGIRSALGANPRRLLTSIFARASVQLGAGMTIGLLIALAIGPAMGAESFISEHGVVVFPIVAGVLTIVGLLGTLGPARQGLSIQPMEALREE